MCVVGAKYINGSWCLFKNRDRNYKADIKIRKSFRRGMERLYIWDDITKYSEGINEFGVAIISASVQVKEDEAEGRELLTKRKEKDIAIKNRTYYSPDGFRIRTALFEKTAKEALTKLIELEIPGNTVIADDSQCFILESAFVDDEYVYKFKEIDRLDPYGVVRTNHGIFLPFSGYSAEIPEQKESRESSESRYNIVSDLLRRSNNEDDVWNAISYKRTQNPQLNPLRIDTSRNAMRTTGQILISIKERTIHYRPIYCDTAFDLELLNKYKEKTFFEIVSTRKLLSFKECLQFKGFK